MTEEQQALVKKARASLKGAQKLMEINLYGFAASRAYYAMFYIAQAFLVGLDLEFSSHAGVIGAFGREFSKTGRLPPEYHRFLIEAQDRRLMGDYGVGIEVSQEKAEQVIAHARQFLDLATSMLGAAGSEDTTAQ